MLFEVGPFRSSPERIDFVDSSGELSNLFLLASGNGRGKTTMLEALYLLMRMLTPDFPSDTDRVHEFMEEKQARLQLDLLVTLEEGAFSREVLLSLSWGDVSESGMSGWKDHPLEEGKADYWLRYGWTRDRQTGELVNPALPLPPDPGKDTWCGWKSPDDAQHVRRRLLQSIKGEQTLKWPGFNWELSSLPTLIYFSANRDIAHRGAREAALGRPVTSRYQIAHRFEREGTEWFASLENLLIWYFWIGAGAFEKARQAVHELVFVNSPNKRIQDEPQRDPPRIMVVNEGRTHPLDRLSSGERNLIQFTLRYGAHRTRHTLLLVDELELHLHPEFQERLLWMLKREASENEGMTVIFTTHSMEIMDKYKHEVPEQGLRKGGSYLLG